MLTFVSEHQRYGEKSVFAAWFSFDGGIGGLQPVDKQQREENNIWRNLRSDQNANHPFSETTSRYRIRA